MFSWKNEINPSIPPGNWGNFSAPVAFLFSTATSASARACLGSRLVPVQEIIVKEIRIKGRAKIAPNLLFKVGFLCYILIRFLIKLLEKNWFTNKGE